MYLDTRRRVLPIPLVHFKGMAGRAHVSDDGGNAAEDHLEGLDGVEYFVVGTDFIVVVGIVVEEKLLLGFRGSKTFYDHCHLNPQVKHAVWHNGGRVHRGFFEEACRILPCLESEIRARNVTDVVYAGHSLGGAVASIADLMWFRRPWRRIVCTFGAPRIGDARFQGAIHPCHLTHVQATRDGVPSLPPRWAGYADNASPIEPSGDRASWKAGWRIIRVVEHLVRQHDVRRYRMQTGAVARATYRNEDIAPPGWIA